MNSVLKNGFLLIILFMLITVKSYGQGKEILDTVSIVGKVLEIKQDKDALGKNIRIITIENVKKKKESFLVNDETKVWIEESEDKLEWVEIGTNAMIDYKIDSKGDKIAVWIYAEERKEEDKFDSAEVDIEPVFSTVNIEIQEDTRNEEFFKGIDSTKLDKDVDLGVKEGEDE